jgi:hypothetical protein
MSRINFLRFLLLRLHSDLSGACGVFILIESRVSGPGLLANV